ncbi:MAG TPA: ferredoxin, partial [Candidatus Angelobacter sp.]|nr:ferredoxin [Candidatus Angelobacter sp.]
MSDPDLAHQREIAATNGVPVARRHIFLCCDQTNPKCCEKARGLEAWEFLKRRLRELGLSEQGGILRSKVNC